MDTNIYLFIGVMATILGFSLVIYTIIMFIAYRRKSKRYIGNIDVAAIREQEENLQLTAPMTAPTTSTTNTISNPFDMLTTSQSVTSHTSSTPLPQPVSAPTVRPLTTSQPNTTANAATTTLNHQQILVALEQLVKQHHMGLIDDQTYQQQKSELFQQLSGVSGTTITTPQPVISDEPKTYTNYEELVIDFTEGIITAKEFEQYKAQFNQ